MDLIEQLRSALAGTYVVERELHGGGMARVFVANEVRLQRRVVIKALAPEQAGGMSAERFQREIMLAARLSHPSIVPVLAAGDAGGVPYYAMPLVNGESLRTRLAVGGALPLGEALPILRDVARALAYAHDQGVVHRDIKPENVLVAGDAAMVTDFGIAKAISVAKTGTGDATLTQVGATVGTPAYMAPEQVSGDPNIGFQADLYSFGCLAYELLLGETPFHGQPVHKILAAHLSVKPPDIAARRPDLPAPLVALLRSCMEKDPELRPASARGMLQALEGIPTPSGAGHVPPRPWKRRNVRAAGGVMLALGIAATVLVMSGRPDLASGSGNGASPLSMAVLPFANIGGDTADAYFADGMAEELATGLAKVPGLRVLSRSSFARANDQSLDVRQIGGELGVTAVLEGTVRRDGSRLRVTARLTDVSDGHVIWNDSYAREASDVFALQDEITRTIVSALQERLALGKGASPGGAASRGTTDLEAYDLYLRGQFLLRRRGPGVRLAAENFSRAIARDPNFARAHAGLSAALELFPYFAEVSADSVFDAATAAAGRALALDSSIAEAHASLALAYQHAYRWDQAEAEYRQAVVRDPNDAATRLHYGRFLLYVGRIASATAELQQARKLDPYSAVHSAWLAYSHHLAGARDSALAEAARAIQLDSMAGPPVALAALVNMSAGNAELARRLSDRFPDSYGWRGSRAYLHAVLGDRESARRIIRELEALPESQWLRNMAIAHAYLGLDEYDRALDALERASQDHEIWPSFWPVSDPMFAPLLDDPRFTALLRRVGLDERAVVRTGIPRRAP